MTTLNPTIRKLRIPLVLVGALALAGCSAQNYGQKQGFGTLLGGAAGAVTGAQFGSGSGRLAMTAIGTLAGAALGNSFGGSLDRADAVYAQRAQNVALETHQVGQVSRWHNPDSGHSGTIEPLNTYQAPSGRYCREYQQTVVVGGQTERAYGTACRQPDGSWQIQDG